MIDAAPVLLIQWVQLAKAWSDVDARPALGELELLAAHPRQLTTVSRVAPDSLQECD